MIKVSGLSFEYVDKKALNNISFTIEQGSITALVGPNGAGKTTLLRCLAALQKPLTGNISVNDIDVIEDPRKAHLNIGYLSDFFGLYDDMNVNDSLLYIACSRNPDVDNAVKAVEWVIEKVNLESFCDKEISKLSRGMRQRVGIAQAIIHQPKVLLLDEPASGLDPEARYALSSLLVGLNKTGMTMLVSSHILAELEDYCTDMLVLNNGSIVEQQVMQHKQEGIVTMQILLDEIPEFLLAKLHVITAIKHIEVRDNQILIKLNEFETGRKKLLQYILELGIQPNEYGEYKVNMQDEYIRTINSIKNQEV
jgi:ABC-2 type transport system ATP-binding protein